MARIVKTSLVEFKLKSHVNTPSLAGFLKHAAQMMRRLPTQPTVWYV